VEAGSFFLNYVTVKCKIKRAMKIKKRNTGYRASPFVSAGTIGAMYIDADFTLQRKLTAVSAKMIQKLR
jgi:hypothetical protein